MRYLKELDRKMNYYRVKSRNFGLFIDYKADKTVQSILTSFFDKIN